MRGEFLSVVGAQNESLRLIIIYYIKLRIWDLNNFARFTSEPKTHLKARFRQTSYKDLVFERGESLSVVGAQNESLRIILMYYMFNY